VSRCSVLLERRYSVQTKKLETRGLTLIEILIALVMLGVLVSFIVSSLASSFQLNRESRKSLDATANAQRIIEEIRGQWETPALYDNACVNLTLTPETSSFMSTTITQKDYNVDATPVNASAPTNITVSAACSGTALAACSSPMKRVFVTSTDVAVPTKILARATLDVICPVVRP
jgi:prepilin-type N-terminal cleavage/methylation domain-containing protein